MWLLVGEGDTNEMHHSQSWWRDMTKNDEMASASPNSANKEVQDKNLLLFSLLILQVFLELLACVMLRCARSSVHSNYRTNRATVHKSLNQSGDVSHSANYSRSGRTYVLLALAQAYFWMAVRRFTTASSNAKYDVVVIGGGKPDSSCTILGFM